MRWARANLGEKDYDVELLMIYLKRSIVPEKLIGNETVIRFHFTDIDTYPDWWLVAKDEELDLCVNDPGREIDVYFTSSVKTLADVWMGLNGDIKWGQTTFSSSFGRSPGFSLGDTSFYHLLDF